MFMLCMQHLFSYLQKISGSDLLPYPSFNSARDWVLVRDISKFSKVSLSIQAIEIEYIICIQYILVALSKQNYIFQKLC